MIFKDPEKTQKITNIKLKIIFYILSLSHILHKVILEQIHLSFPTFPRSFSHNIHIMESLIMR